MDARMSTNPVRRARALKRQADVLLAQLQLIPLLAKYGQPTFTGSYLYDLMTWRDIDICLTVCRPTMETVGRIVRDMSSLRALATVYIRNELVLRTPGNPCAIFVCAEFFRKPKTTWKIDILIGSRQVVERTIAPGREMTCKLNQQLRKRILTIKSVLCTEPSYRQEIKSTDIYRAVINDGVEDLKGWNDWRRSKK
jgi:hypothetical protein